MSTHQKLCFVHIWINNVFTAGGSNENFVACKFLGYQRREQPACWFIKKKLKKSQPQQMEREIEFENENNPAAKISVILPYFFSINLGRKLYEKKNTLFDWTGYKRPDLWNAWYVPGVTFNSISKLIVKILWNEHYGSQNALYTLGILQHSKSLERGKVGDGTECQSSTI